MEAVGAGELPGPAGLRGRHSDGPLKGDGLLQRLCRRPCGAGLGSSEGRAAGSSEGRSSGSFAEGRAAGSSEGSKGRSGSFAGSSIYLSQSRKIAKLTEVPRVLTTSPSRSVRRKRR